MTFIVTIINDKLSFGGFGTPFDIIYKKNKNNLKFKAMGKTTFFEELVDQIFSSEFFKSGVSSPLHAKHYVDDETNEHVLVIQAAGFKKEDINIEVTAKGIDIQGKIADEKLKTRIIRNEFYYVYHSAEIDAETIDASLENGILTIKFKFKTEPAKKVTIK